MREYANRVPKNALDLALDICGPYENSSIVGMLVTAGAEMTGNSQKYHMRKAPYQWRRVRGPQGIYCPEGYQGQRLDPQGEAALRRSDRTASIIDPPSANTHLDVGPVTAETEVGDDDHPLAAPTEGTVQFESVD